MFKNIVSNLKYYLNKIINSRIGIVSAVFVIFAIILIARVFYLQVIRADYYMNNYIQRTEKTVYTEGTRGNIYDRNGNVLAYNKLAYSVIMEDPSNDDETTNAIINKTISIIEKHGDSVVNNFPIIAQSDGSLTYATSSESELIRFLINVYGIKKAEVLEKGYDKQSADETFKYICSDKKFGISDDYSLESKLKIACVRYELSLNYYQKYLSTTIASNVSDETVAAILENKNTLDGVDISQDTVRIYNNSVYFAPILGYTGEISEDEIESLNAKTDSFKYESGDTIGKSGIEEYFDTTLQGTKGEEKVLVDSMGNVLDSEVKTTATAGNNIYLTLDANLQIATYHMLEQKIAGILLSKIVNYDFTPTTESKVIYVPIKDVYYQMLNNNVVDISILNREGASETELNVYNKYQDRLTYVLGIIQEELTSTNEAPLNGLSSEYNEYMWYIFDALKSDSLSIINTQSLDAEDKTYIAFLNDEISMQDFLLYAIQNGWVNTSNIKEGAGYSNSDEIYADLVDFIINYLKENTGFAKKIYYYMVYDGSIGGNEICRMIYDQGVLPYDEAAYASLGNYYAAYSWMVGKISTLEITPAMVALDPCSGSVVVTDVNTGNVLALVTYPSYDNNKLSGTVDSTYWNKLTNDLSLPLYNRATQTRTAPGSTFKPLTSITALEEGIITDGTYIQDLSEFKTITPSPKCWIYPGSHGSLNVVGALQNSCNYFFYEVGYRLGSSGGGGYDSSYGLSLIEKYANIVGLTTKSGVEISENEPHFSDQNAVTTAIGQGSNSYTNIQLARYTTTVANGGTCYKLTLFDKATDVEGNVIFENEPVITSEGEISASTISTVHQGMRAVVASGTAAGTFSGVDFSVAGKTGTAEENKLRSSHAVFIGFTPYENPEIAVSVVMPFGDSSGYSTEMARDVMKYYYGEIPLESILTNAADIPATSVVHD